MYTLEHDTTKINNKKFCPFFGKHENFNKNVGTILNDKGLP